LTVRILHGDCREVLATLPDASVHCCVTSPPYFGLRDYGVDGQIGLEQTPDAFVAELVAVFREVRRVLRDDGTLWLNLGDSYASTTKGSGGTGASTLQNDGRSEDARLRGALKAQERQAMGPRRFDMGDLKAKDLIGIPWRVAFALQADGWWLRQDIIWHKPNPMPESVTDRCTKAHEYVFLLSKAERYFYDASAIHEDALTDLPIVDKSARSRNRLVVTAAGREGADEYGSIGAVAPGKRNKRSVWTVATQPYSGAHFATMPPELAEQCIKAGCPEGGTVLDPFGGAGTTGLVADRLQRHALLVELNPAYIDIAERRITGDAPLFAEVSA
jgi:DNA modification methylase